MRTLCLDRHSGAGRVSDVGRIDFDSGGPAASRAPYGLCHPWVDRSSWIGVQMHKCRLEIAGLELTMSALGLWVLSWPWGSVRFRGSNAGRVRM